MTQSHEYLALDTQLRETKQPSTCDTPIHRLPPDILLQIFDIIVAEWASLLPQDSDNSSDYALWNWRWTREEETHFPSYSWIPSICHTCMYWRELALNSACLWNRVIVTQHDSLPTILERSQAVTISAFYFITHEYSDAEKQQRVYDTLLPYFDRVRELHIASVLPFDIVRGILPKGPFSQIQELTLLLPKSKKLEDENPGQDIVDSESAFWSRWMNPEYDRLVSLSLTATSLSAVRLTVRPSIRHLSLRHLPQSVTTSMLLSFLKQSPSLESLLLFHATPGIWNTGSESLEPSEVVTLPDLRSLHIVSPGQSLMNFIRHITYPALTSLTLDLIDVQEWPLNPEHLGAELVQKLLPDLQHISFRNGNRKYALYGWHTLPPDTPLYSETHPISAPCIVRFPHQDSCECHISFLMEAFGGMMAKVNAEHLRSVHLDLDPPPIHDPEGFNSDFFYTVGRKAVNMHSLYASSTYHLGLVFGCNDTKVSLPELRYLWMTSVRKNEIFRLVDILKDWAEKYGMVLDVLSVPRGYNDSCYESLIPLVHSLEIRE